MLLDRLVDRFLRSVGRFVFPVSSTFDEEVRGLLAPPRTGRRFVETPSLTVSDGLTVERIEVVTTAEAGRMLDVMQAAAILNDAKIYPLRSRNGNKPALYRKQAVEDLIARHPGRFVPLPLVDENDRYLTTDEAAEYLGCATTTLSDRVRNCGLPIARYGNGPQRRQALFRLSDLVKQPPINHRRNTRGNHD